MTPITAEADHDCAWKQAILDAAIVNWTYTAEHERHPGAAVNALLVQAQREALDPLISPEAAALHAQVAQLRAEAAVLQRHLAAESMPVHRNLDDPAQPSALVLRLVTEVGRLTLELETVRAQLAALTGEPFSDRVHAALRARAEQAEREAADLRAQLAERDA